MGFNSGFKGLKYRDIILSDNSHHSLLGLFHATTGRVQPGDRKWLVTFYTKWCPYTCL